MDNKEIGNRIKQARVIRNMSLQDIADSIGVARSTVQRYEKGTINKIKLPVVESIANALNVKPDWIIGKTEIMAEYKNTTKTDIRLQKIIDHYNKMDHIGKDALVEQAEFIQHKHPLNKTNEGVI